MTTPQSPARVGEVKVACAATGYAASVMATPVGTVGSRLCLGEISLVSATPHSATAIARNEVKTSSLTYDRLHDLVRHRPDIGVVIYRNVALQLGKKLQESDKRLADLAPKTDLS